jgi:transposase-like protein
MSGKRKRVVVSLECKFNAIKRLDRGESIKKVAQDLGVGEVTVGDWRRARKNIEQWVNQSVSGGSGLRWRNIAASKRGLKMTQKSIKDFFKT